MWQLVLTARPAAPPCQRSLARPRPAGFPAGGQCRVFTARYRSDCRLPTMRECLSIHIGQAGVQIGNSCWEVGLL